MHEEIGWTRGGGRIWAQLSPALVGLVFAVVSRRQRQHVRRNLRTMLGPRRRWREWADVARTFMHFAASLADAVAVAGHDEVHIVLDLDGEPALREALGRGRALVLVMAHTAGWELAVAELKRRIALGAEAGVAQAEAANSRVVRSWSGLARFEGRTGGSNGSSSAGGGPGAYHVDRCASGAAQRKVRMFGRSYAFPSEPFEHAAATGASLLPVFSYRIGALHYGLYIADPIPVSRRATAGQLDRAAQRVAWELDRFLRAHPTQWFHFAV